MKKLHCALILAGLAMSPAASAEIYLGLAGGVTNSNAAERLSQTFIEYQTVEKTDTNKAGYGAFGGYAFNRNLAVEVAYFDFGKYVAKGNFYDIFSVSDSLEASAYSVGVVGSLPLGERFSLFAKLGVGVVSQKYHCEVLLCDILPDKTTDSTVITGAIGARWHASKHFAVRAAYEHFGGARYRIDRSDGEKFSKNVDYGLLYAAAELSF